MGRKKRPEPDDKEQSARFVELAERIKAENDNELFEQAVQKIIRVKRVAHPQKTKEPN